MGDKGKSLTELMGGGIPVLVARYPDREPVVLQGWTIENPRSAEALWHLSELLGHRKDNPATWKSSREGWHPVGLGLASWAENRTSGWGATIDAREIIDWVTSGGRRQIAKGAYLVVPDGFRPRLVGNRIEFREPPYVEYKIAFITRRATLSHIEIAPDFSRVTVHAKNFRTGFPVNIRWGN
jgi:hypothetical protein